MEKLKDIIVNFLAGKEGLCATLPEIYQAVAESGREATCSTWQASARRTIYENTDTFKRVVRGVWMLTGEKAVSLLIDGSGRELKEIEDSSVDLIITDHPWDCAKSNKGGNRDFATYDTFKYELSDFEAKARVLKEGAYCVEFLPVESQNNWRYLASIKDFAERCGLQYYASCIWRSAPEGTKNTGRTCKGVQQIIIFSKGKPRKFSPDNVQGYQTHTILPYELDFPVASQAKYRNHPAEKPVALYEYLIKQFTEEQEVCLDQFAGSCNLLQAAVNTNRFGVAFEIAKEYVDKAVSRFGLINCYRAEDIEVTPIVNQPGIFTCGSNGQIAFNI